MPFCHTLGSCARNQGRRSHSLGVPEESRGTHLPALRIVQDQIARSRRLADGIVPLIVNGRRGTADTLLADGDSAMFFPLL